MKAVTPNQVANDLKSALANRPSSRPFAMLLFATFTLICATTGAVLGGLGGEAVGPIKQVVVLPFRSVDDDKDTAALGDEIADCLSNRLNKLDGAAVINQDVVQEQGRGTATKGLKTSDALARAADLNADYLVTGSYKRVGTKLELECFIVDVKLGEKGKALEFAEQYPEGYRDVMHKLADGVEQGVRKTLGKPAPLAAKPIEVSANIEANQLYATGLHETGAGNSEGFERARTALQSAVEKDTEFAQAYAALADAEARLAKLKEAAHEDSKQERADAVLHAKQAVKIAPYYGEAHWQLSRALLLTGDYEGAELASRVANVLSPANPEVHLDRSRALAQGKIVNNDELKTALAMTPAIVLIVPELPKVKIANDGRVAMLVKYTQDDGTVVATLHIPPGGSTFAGVLPGHYTITTTAGGQSKTQKDEFTAGTPYSLDNKTLAAEAPPAPPVAPKPPVDTAPAKPASTTIYVHGNVDGANVSIDGVSRGAAPAEFVVAVGKDPKAPHTVSISADGYKTEELSVSLKEGANNAVPFTLSPNAPVTPPTQPDTHKVSVARVMKQNEKAQCDIMLVPSGDFTMGEKGLEDNKPHTVHISAYWIGKTPITVKQFQVYTDAADGYDASFHPRFDWEAHKPPYGWKDDQPMVNIRWSEAQAYCHWAGGELPTEAQWEYAARGPEGFTFPWGNTFDAANLQWSATTGSATGTVSVLSHEAGMSPFGCLDMEGNVGQWCLDGYQPDLTGLTMDPVGIGATAVVRGGDWSLTKPELFHAALRFRDNPQFGTKIDRLDRSPNIGFRIAMPFVPAPQPGSDDKGAAQPPAKPVVTPPANKPVLSSMIIDSNVRGAHVSFDGVDIGTTPLERSIDPSKAYNVIVSAPGYTNRPFTCYPIAGKKDTFMFFLRHEGESDTPSAGQVSQEAKSGMDFVYIPETDFNMGAKDQLDNEVHNVTLSGYWIGKTPVTVAQFRAFADAADGYKTLYAEGFDWAKRLPNAQDDHPMENVTWIEAQAYCKWIGGDLPTEAQWEHAARGQEDRRYPWGNDWNATKLQCSLGAWGSTGNSASVAAHTAGASGYGCLDMAGNVSQWCRDFYQRHLTGSTRDPIGSGETCVARGGSYLHNKPEFFESAARMSKDPISGRMLERNDHYRGLGFRVVKTSM